MNKEKPYEISDEAWNGNEPAHVGGKWGVNDEYQGYRYQCYFGGGEAIDTDGDGIPDKLVSAEINHGNERIFFHGNLFPYVRYIDFAKGIKIDSGSHAPQWIAFQIRKFMQYDEMKNRFGEMLINRMPECLDFSFEEFMRGEQND